MPTRKVDPPHNQEIILKEHPRCQNSSVSRIISGVRPAIVAKIQLKKVPVRLMALGQISVQQRDKLFSILKARFKKKPKYYERPNGFDCKDIMSVISNAEGGYAYSLAQMEIDSGMPDVLAIDDKQVVFADFSSESPMGRRGYTYPMALRNSEKSGLKMMSKSDYAKLQQSGLFDMDSFSWLLTPPSVRADDRAFIAHYNQKLGMVEYDDYKENAGDEAGYVGWRSVLEIPRV